MGNNLVFKANFSQDEQKDCIVDKVIRRSDYLYEQLLAHPPEEDWDIRKNRTLLRENKDGFHCILFVNNDTGDGLLVGAKSVGSPLLSQHISHAGDILLAQELTGSEIALHEFLHMVGNEEAKLIGMEGNRRFPEGIVAGPFFICGTEMTDDGEDFCSLSDELCEKYVKRFAEPEKIPQEEVEADIGYRLIFF